MPQFKYTPRDIYETDFSNKVRGYDKDQVDEMLDNVIVDYETYAAELLRLEEENEFLKSRVAELEGGRKPNVLDQFVPSRGTATDLAQTQRFDALGTQDLTATSPVVQPKEPSNFDLLKRINRLERAVFGPDSKFSSEGSDNN